MKKLLFNSMNQTTKLKDIMTSPKVADMMMKWLYGYVTMSNERFRHVPVVDKLENLLILCRCRFSNFYSWPNSISS